MPDALEYHLANVDNMSLEQVDAVLAVGGRFVLFHYAVSVIFMTWSTPTRIWLVRNDDEARRIARRFSILTALLGWWGFPHGPIESIKALAVNRGGGVDVTSEVRSSLTEDTLSSGVVRFEGIAVFESADHFVPIAKHELKDLTKCLRPILERHRDVGAVWACRFAGDDNPNGEPFSLYFAMNAWDNLHTQPAGVDDDPPEIDATLRAECEKALRKVFRSWIAFEFVVMGNDEMSKLVAEHGARIYDRSAA